MSEELELMLLASFIGIASSMITTWLNHVFASRRANRERKLQAELEARKQKAESAKQIRDNLTRGVDELYRNKYGDIHIDVNTDDNEATR